MEGQGQYAWSKSESEAPTLKKSSTAVVASAGKPASTRARNLQHFLPQESGSGQAAESLGEKSLPHVSHCSNSRSYKYACAAAGQLKSALQMQMLPPQQSQRLERIRVEAPLCWGVRRWHPKCCCEVLPWKF